MHKISSRDQIICCTHIILTIAKFSQISQIRVCTCMPTRFSLLNTRCGWKLDYNTFISDWMFYFLESFTNSTLSTTTSESYTYMYTLFLPSCQFLCTLSLGVHVHTFTLHVCVSVGSLYDHPLVHVCCLFPQKMYLIMELCKGGELSVKLRKKTYFKEPVSRITCNYIHVFTTPLNYQALT